MTKLIDLTGKKHLLISLPLLSIACESPTALPPDDGALGSMSHCVEWVTPGDGVRYCVEWIEPVDRVRVQRPPTRQFPGHIASPM